MTARSAGDSRGCAGVRRRWHQRHLTSTPRRAAVPGTQGDAVDMRPDAVPRRPSGLCGCSPRVTHASSRGGAGLLALALLLISRVSGVARVLEMLATLGRGAASMAITAPAARTVPDVGRRRCAPDRSEAPPPPPRCRIHRVTARDEGGADAELLGPAAGRLAHCRTRGSVPAPATSRSTSPSRIARPVPSRRSGG